MSTCVLQSPIKTSNEIGENMKNKLTPVQQFYFNTDIFITGATGFVGKALVEKLLRSCPDINTLYLLIRAKRGKSVEERVADIFADRLFDTIKEQTPDFLSKIVIINGDLTSPGYGINEEDRLILIENVNIVFHCGATVRFQEPLGQAVKTNVVGTKIIINLAKRMKHLKSFVYVSTAYSNCNRPEVDEVLYEPPINPENLIQLCNSTKEDVLNQITPILLKDWPNTYTFTKAVGEAYVKEAGSKLPVCVFRPSVVTPGYKEPVPGWIDNINGLNGIGYGMGTGLIHIITGRRAIHIDLIPIDIVVNALVVAAWDQQFETNIEDVKVYNCVTASVGLPSGEFIDLVMKEARKMPFSKAAWYYTLLMVNNKFLCKLLTFLCHTIPATIIDLLLIISRNKPIAVRGFQKASKFVEVTSFFSKQEWKFGDFNMRMLYEKLNTDDKKLFNSSVQSIDWQEYVHNACYGGRLYLFNDDPSTIPAARKRMERLKILHYTFLTIIYVFSFWLVFRLLKFIFL